MDCSPDKPVRVFLVDDHPATRHGVERLLETLPGVSVCGEAGSGEEALELIPEVHTDLAIVDIAMEGMDGIELTRRLAAEQPCVRVLIVSMHGDVTYVEAALEAGAGGYVLKESVSDVIAEALESVLAGRRYLSPQIRGEFEGE